MKEETKKRSFFAKVTNLFSDRRLKRENVERLHTLLTSAVSDGKITDEEMFEINNFQKENEIGAEDFVKIRDTVFNSVASNYMSDRRITEAEEDSLINMASRLGMSGPSIQAVKDHLAYFKLLDQLENVPFDQLPVTGRSGIVLQKNELDYVSFDANMIEERVVRNQYVGGSRGVSIRLMKGVSYRVGQSRGHIQSERAFVPVSSGQFVVTNQRLVFTGDRKSVNAPLAKIMNIDLFADGLRFSLTNRQKPVNIQFFTEQSAEVVAMYISRILNQ